MGTALAMAVWLFGLSRHEGERVVDPVAGQEQPAAQPVADPAMIRVASLGIEAGTIALGKQPDGSLEVPESAYVTGWWTGGANPGERGASVIVGHVDSREGPGVFFGLAGVVVGERVTVERVDGSSVHFRVGRVETHPKGAFPTEAVYGHTDAPTLRLVTCAGRFDPAARSYDDNLIVFADFETDEAGIAARTPMRASAGESDGAGTPTPGAAVAATTPAPDRGVPIGLGALSVIGVAAAVTRQVLRVPPGATPDGSPLR